MASAELEDIARELYALPPEDFIRARNDRVAQARGAGKQALADQIRRLRKPTTAAWLVNMLVRRRADEVGQILALGAQLREAQRNLEGDQLRRLDRQRRTLIAAVTGQTRELGSELSHRVSDQIAAEVAETLRAATIDADAASAVSTGLLTESLEATGLGHVDLDGATAVAGARSAVQHGVRRPPPPAEAPSRGPTGGLRARSAATRDLEQAQATLRDVQQRANEAHRRVAEARTDRVELEAEHQDLQRRLRSLDREVRQAERREKAAEREHDKLERETSAAEHAVAAARERLKRLG